MSVRPAVAQEPEARTTRLVPFSGILPDADDAIAAGVRIVEFTLFDEAEGGTPLWSESQAVTADTQGRFAVYLGAAQPLPLDIFRAERARWLQVSLNGRGQPRVMLVAVPYALRAADAETLGGEPLSSFVLAGKPGRRGADATTVEHANVDGSGVPNQLAKWSGGATLSSSVLTESYDNRLGILAPDPTGGGAVDSRFTIRNPDNNTAIAILNPLNARRFALNTGGFDGGFVLYDGGGGTWNRGIMQEGGFLGIGVTKPRYAIDVVTSNHTTTTGAFQILHPTSVHGAVSGITNATTNGQGHAISGYSSGNGVGVYGNSAAGPGIYGQSTTSHAGRFFGNVQVTGTLTKGGGAFQIDHPLDPENKYLSHSFVESPDMMNVYNGNVTLDGNGEAWVSLPEWFEALNRDFRYQLTAMGRPGPTLYVADEVAGNRFRIAGGAPGGKVSWQVTGIRQDAWANANRIQVEQVKPEGDRGSYLHPLAFDRPASLIAPSLLVKPVPAIQERMNQRR